MINKNNFINCKPLIIRRQLCEVSILFYRWRKGATAIWRSQLFWTMQCSGSHTNYRNSCFLILFFSLFPSSQLQCSCRSIPQVLIFCNESLIKISFLFFSKHPYEQSFISQLQSLTQDLQLYSFTENSLDFVKSMRSVISIF